MAFERREIIDASLESGVLKSIDFGLIVDCLCEGQIEGSASASKARITDKNSTAYRNAFLKDLFLNKIAVLQAAASNTAPTEQDFNYPVKPDVTNHQDKLTFNFQDGTVNNKILLSRNEQTALVPLGPTTELTFPEGGSATSRSVSITNPNVDAVQVKIKFDQFFKLNPKNGDRNSTEVRIIIKINPNNSSQTTVISEPIQGKSFNAYNVDFGINFTTATGFNKTIGSSSSFFPVVVSVERGNDEGDQNTFNTARLSEVREIIREQNNYPHIAYSTLRFSTELFTSAPLRNFRIRGKLIKIPHNMDVDYTNGRLVQQVDNNGDLVPFNGTFKAAKEWCSDPAWVLYDLLISHEERITRDSNNVIIKNEQYGADIPESSLDPFSFFKVSKYCNQLVQDDNNNLEPRFSINVNIQNRRGAMQAINDICTVMNAIPFYEEGTIKIAQDAPKDLDNPTAVSFDYVFNNANVVEGAFVYSGTSSKTRFNVINVSFLNLDSQEVDYETVEDTASQAKYGVQTKNINSFGVTSRSQAGRVGRWFLLTQQDQTETCTFETNIAAGSVVTVGSIIGIADRVKAASRRGGIVKSATQSAVTIDDASANTLPSLTNSPTISCMLSNGTVETKTISGYTGNVVSVTNDQFSSAPVENSPYILEEATQKVLAFRVVDIKENTGKTYTISAINYNPNKYNVIDNEGATLTPRPTVNVVTKLLEAPTIRDGSIREVITVDNGTNLPVSKLFIDWEPVTGASGYHLIYRKDNEDPIVVRTQLTEFEVVNAGSGTYNIKVFTINGLGQKSTYPVEKVVNTVGLTEPPENPTNLIVEALSNTQVRVSWDKALAVDVLFGGFCILRHDPKTISQGANFTDATDISETITGSSNEFIAPAMQGTYFLKFQDSSLIRSATAANVEFNFAEIQDELLIKEQRENPSFSGNKPSNHLQVVSNELLLTNPATSLTGTYEFASVFDLEAKYTNVRFQRHIDSAGFFVSGLFDSIVNVDQLENFDGEGSETIKSLLKIQTSDDNVTYSTSQPLFNGLFVGRYFKFESEIISVDANENMKIKELGFDAFLPARTENKYQDGGVGGTVKSEAQQSTTSASGKDVVFANRFFTGTTNIGGSTTTFLPSISIAPEDMSSGVSFALSNISGTGFTVLFTDASGSPVNVKFTFQAVGYGKGS